MCVCSLLNNVGQQERYYNGYNGPTLQLPDFNTDAIKKEMRPILMCHNESLVHNANGHVSKGYLLNNKR